MRNLYEGQDRYHGTCKPFNFDNVKDTCHNQFYWIVIERTRKFGEPFHSRKVLSIGWIWRGYGHSIDIPLSRWRPDPREDKDLRHWIVD